MAESNGGVTVPWKWVAGLAVGLVISIGGYVIKGQADQIKAVQATVAQVKQDLAKEQNKLSVADNEQKNLRRRIRTLENEAADMMERWMKYGSSVMGSHKRKSMLLQIKKFRKWRR